MPTDSGTRSTWLTALALFLGLAFALGAAGYDQYFGPPFLETGDAGVNALQIDNAGHFRELYGNYSRWEFSHPGPAFFYVYAAGESVFHTLLGVCASPGNAHILTSMLLQVLFFSLALAILASHFRWRTFLPLAVVAGAWYFGRISAAVAPSPGPFMSIWPPWVLLMPALSFLVACVSVANGRSNHLIIATLSGGFLFHGHVAQPLFVGSLGTLALLGWRHGERMLPWRDFLRKHRPAWRASTALALLFLLPLAIDVLTLGTRSNVATIVGRFYSNTSDETGSKTLGESTEYFLTFATPATNQEFLFPQVDPGALNAAKPASLAPALLRDHPGSLAFWAAVVLGAPLLAWLLRRRLEPGEGRFLAIAYGFLAAAIVVCLVWGLAQAGLMYHFNGLFYYAVYYFALLLALGLAVRLLEALAVSPVVAAGFAVAAVIFTWSFRLPRLSPGGNGELVLAGVEAALQADPTDKPKLLVFEHRDWPTVAGIALELQRRNIPYFVNPYWEYMFGQRHDQTRLGAAPEDKTAVWWITSPEKGDTVIEAPGGVPLAIHLQPEPVRPQDAVLDFKSGENGFRHLISGLTVGNKDHASTVLPRLAFIFQPETAERDVRLVFEAAATANRKEAPAGQPAEVFFNGESLGKVTAGERAELSLTIPRELWNRSPRAKLEVRFPGAVPVRALKRPRYEIWPAWDLWAIRFRYADKAETGR
jgi:hypothetical protein